MSELKNRKVTSNTDKKKKKVSNNNEQQPPQKQKAKEVDETVEVIDNKKLNKKIKADDDIASTSTPQSTVAKQDDKIKYGAKKYSQRELEEIRQANKIVLLKFIIFTILMILVPFGLYFWWMDYGADYFQVIRRERTTYGGVIALVGMAFVMVSYAVMAMFEK